MNTIAYESTFFADLRGGSARSARVIVALMLEMSQDRPVIDVGCGVGPWLRTSIEHGVSDMTGLDGDYVERAELEIPVEFFHATDLTSTIPITREVIRR